MKRPVNDKYKQALIEQMPLFEEAVANLDCSTELKARVAKQAHSEFVAWAAVSSRRVMSAASAARYYIDHEADFQHIADVIMIEEIAL